MRAEGGGYGLTEEEFLQKCLGSLVVPKYESSAVKVLTKTCEPTVGGLQPKVEE
jgi:hypothetical protein